MTNLLEGLLSYFNNTPHEQIEKAWIKTEKYDKIGPTIEEFFYQNNSNSIFGSIESVCSFNILNKLKNKNPKFSSDFFYLRTINYFSEAVLVTLPARLNSRTEMSKGV